MAGLQASAKRRTDILWFDPRILKVKPDLNARALDTPESVEHIEWLSQSIAVEGVKKPLKVFYDGGEIFVADGHCRLAATMKAIERGVDIASIPCIAEPKGTNDVERKLDQILDNSGRPLSPLEAGENIKYAVAKGWTAEQIAKKLGKSVSYVNGALSLQGADSSVHQAIRAGEISATAAAQIVRAEKENAPAVVRAAVETAKAEGKKKATAKTIRELSPRSAPRKAGDSVNPQVLSFGAGDFKIKQPSAVSRDLTIAIKGVVLIAPSKVWDELAMKALEIIDAMPKEG